MATPKQVQLRGGTTEEHNAFTGASREITIDTTLNTIRVHDGLLQGGHIICKQQDLDKETTRLDTRIDDMQENLGGSHNHDDRYALKNHNHDEKYYIRLNGGFNVCSKVINGYHGLCGDNGSDTSWYRTTTNGLLPYQSGGYSAIGSSGWKFNEGWFNTINANAINVHKNGNVSRINFSAQQNDPGFIEHYENNNHSTMRICVSDDDIRSDEIQLGVAPGGNFKTNLAIRGDGSIWARGTLECQSWIAINGRRLYIGSRPSDAPNGSVSIG